MQFVLFWLWPAPNKDILPVAGLEPAQLFKIPEGVYPEFAGSGELGNSQLSGKLAADL
jgi:hypothetical protein